MGANESFSLVQYNYLAFASIGSNIFVGGGNIDVINSRFVWLTTDNGVTWTNTNFPFRSSSSERPVFALLCKWNESFCWLNRTACRSFIYPPIVAKPGSTVKQWATSELCGEILRGNWNNSFSLAPRLEHKQMEFIVRRIWWQKLEPSQ